MGVRVIVSLAVSLGVAVVSSAESANSRVKVSSFGFDAGDSTVAIKAALASGTKTVVFDDKGSPWVTSETVALHSDLEVVFEEGVEGEWGLSPFDSGASRASCFRR